jgi:hypothetical protein
MKHKTTLYTPKVLLLICLITLAPAIAQVQFTPQTIQLGELSQGETRKVQFTAQNTGSQPLQIETIMSQNIGSSEFSYPQTVAPGQSFTVHFSFTSAYLSGEILHRIILVQTDGSAHVLPMTANIIEPVLLYSPVNDIGYYQQNQERTVSIYAWAHNKQKFNLAADSLPAGVQAKIAPVSLNIQKGDAGLQITENGSTPGYRITLQVKNPARTSKSIRLLIPFTSSNYPLATPEVQIIGYWQ